MEITSTEKQQIQGLFAWTHLDQDTDKYPFVLRERVSAQGALKDTYEKLNPNKLQNTKSQHGFANQQLNSQLASQSRSLVP